MYFIAAKGPDDGYYIEQIENDWHDAVDGFEPIDVINGEVIVYDETGHKFWVGPGKNLKETKLFWKIKSVEVGEWNFKEGEPYLIDTHESVPDELKKLLLDYIDRIKLEVPSKNSKNLEDLVLHVALERVKKDIPKDVLGAHGHCNNNKAELESSKLCGCFYCLHIFSPAEIEEWVDSDETTALCPSCGIDSVLGDISGFPITKEFLNRMHKHWF
jgi:hypothetical protein